MVIKKFTRLNPSVSVGASCLNSDQAVIEESSLPPRSPLQVQRQLIKVVVALEAYIWLPISDSKRHWEPVDTHLTPPFDPDSRSDAGRVLNKLCGLAVALVDPSVNNSVPL